MNQFASEKVNGQPFQYGLLRESALVGHKSIPRLASSFMLLLGRVNRLVRAGTETGSFGLSVIVQITFAQATAMAKKVA